MESGADKKLKVAWICHFSNKEMRERLPLSELKWKNILKKILSKKINGYSDFAPWVSNLIREFENIDEVELHVVGPFTGLKYFTYEFEMNGVFYHFYKPIPGLFFLHQPLINYFYRVGKYFLLLNRYFVFRFINKIKPDIVNLIGTENPYYSITALDIKKIPVYVSAQTVYTNPDRKKYTGNYLKLNGDIELKIHKKEKYFGCTGRMHRDLIKRNNADAIVFKMFFPIERPKNVEERPKIYDFVFFGGIEKKKGIEDLIEAMAIVKKERPEVTLNVVGACSMSYRNSLSEKIKSLELNENIVFDNYFPDISDLHQHIIQSHFAVLPVKLDSIPGTILEAIFLDIPVVTYKTTGTPYLNSKGEVVLMGDIGDTDTLAKNMLKLMNSPGLAMKLRVDAKAFVEHEFDNTKSALRLVSNYRAIIKHYKNDIPIPADQLFDVEEFQIY